MTLPNRLVLLFKKCSFPIGFPTLIYENSNNNTRLRASINPAICDGAFNTRKSGFSEMFTAFFVLHNERVTILLL